MIQNVLKASRMLQDILECSRRFKNVPGDSRMFQEILECFRRFQNVPEDSRTVYNEGKSVKITRNSYF
jgi:hypothetical protein